MKISEKRCVVLDMDGTVYLGNIPIQGAVDFIKENWKKLDFHFLSNNTSKAPDTYVEKLNAMGIPATLDLILSPTTPLVDFLKEKNPHGLYSWQQRFLPRPFLTYARTKATGRRSAGRYSGL